MDDPAGTAARATAAGLNTIRIVNFLDEVSAPSTGAYDEWRWARLDRLVAAAGSSGLKVILDLSTYRNMLANAGMNPYAHDWGPFVSFAANRRNSVTGIRYGDDPAIALVAIAGEVEPINTPENRLGITSSQVTDFFKRTFGQWRSLDTVHPVTSGGLLHYGWDSGIDWRAIFAGADVCSIHNYSAGDVAATPSVAGYCAGLNKPWITEEFGWETSVADASRAVSFQAIYDLNRANGSAGVAFWNLGAQTQMPTYDVNDATPLTLDVVRRNAR
jgi:endo-1,4-beta-mannosidase